MKIVDTDNFNGDYPNEQVIAENITNQYFADLICKLLNEDGGPYAGRYYKVVEDTYQLQPGFEP